MPVSDHAGRQAEEFSVQCATDGSWAVVSVSGELDIETVGVLRDALQAAFLPDGWQDLALDVSALTFCDSAGLGLLLGVREQLRPRDGRLILLHTPPHLAMVLHETGLSRLFPSYESLDAVE